METKQVMGDVKVVRDDQGGFLYSACHKFTREQAEGFSMIESAALELMKQTGGSFASSLAVAFLRADLGNRRAMLAAFGDLFYRYALQAAAMKERDPRDERAAPWKYSDNSR